MKLLSLTTILLLCVGCSTQDQHKISLSPVPVCPSGCGEVHSEGMPTLSDYAHWTPGTYWIWKRLKNPKDPSKPSSVYCEKWTYLSAAPPGGYTQMQLNPSTNCTDYLDSEKEFFGFSPDGTTKDEQGTTTGLTTVLDHLLVDASTTQIDHMKNHVSIHTGDKGYAIFAMGSEKGSYYIESATVEPQLNGVLFRGTDWLLIDYKLANPVAPNWQESDLDKAEENPGAN